MSEPDKDPSGEDQLFREAAGWFARMRGPDASISQPEFERWLARGALHRAAYNRAAEVFALGKLLGSEESPSPAGAPRPQLRMGALVPAAFAALLLAGLGAWASLDPTDRPDRGNPERTQIAALATGAGETQRLKLADGSIVTLDSGTRLAARFDGRARRLTLEHGKARFYVAHEARPFTVFAGGGSVTARGTLFDVALSSDRQVSVHLVEGLIDVRLPARAPAARPLVRQLRRGQSIRFPVARERAGQTASVPSPSAASATGGGGAHVGEFDHIRLADLVASANRHGGRPIRFAQAELGDLRISGRFRTDEPELLAARLALLFDLVLDRSDPAALVLRRR